MAEEQYAEGINEVNRQIKEVVSETAECGWITSKGAEHTREEPVHFAPEGLRELGRRFAIEYKNRWVK